MTGSDQPPTQPNPTPVEGADPPDPVGPPPKKPGRGKLGVGLAVAGGGIGVIFVKFILPLVLVGVAGEVIGVAFGGPYMRLPGDTRQAFETRLEAAVGDSLDNLSDQEQATHLEALVEGGLPRLGDPQVDANFRLASKAINAVDDASCATLARAIFAGTTPPEDASTAMVGALSETELAQWFEIRVAAIEAERRGTPEPILVSDEAVSPLYEKLFVIMNAAHLDTIGAMAGGETVEDADLCAAVRGLYTAVLSLTAEEVTLFARYDISP